MTSNLHQFLSRNIFVTVGEQDNIVDSTTRSGELINKQQGPDRFTRAQRWSNELHKKCLQLNIEPRIKFSSLKGCGHNIFQCIETGSLDRLFINTFTSMDN